MIMYLLHHKRRYDITHNRIYFLSLLPDKDFMDFIGYFVFVRTSQDYWVNLHTRYQECNIMIILD